MPIQFMRFKPFCAPKRFIFTDPDTGFEYRADNKNKLMHHIVNYRLQNGLPPLEQLTTVLDNYWCSLPENCGECVPGIPLKRGLYAYLKGGIALLETLAYPKKHIVAQEEADRRADICMRCQYNSFPDKDAFIAWSDNIAQATIGDRKSKYYEYLGNCEICSCCLKAKVWFNGDMGLNDKQVAAMSDVSCWQVEKKDG